MGNPGGTPANLLKGGKPGNRGGKGAIPTTLRAMCREGWAKGIPNIVKIAIGEVDGVSPNESVSAWNALGKYGVGELTDVSVENPEIAKAAVRCAHQIYGDAKLQEFTDLLLTTLGIVADDDIDGPADDPNE